MKKIILPITLLFFSLNAFAFSPYYLGIGNVTHNFLTAQNDTSGGTKKFEFAPMILVGLNTPSFFDGIFFNPAIGYAKFFTEDKSTKSEIILQYHLSQSLLSGLQLHYGFSNYITTIGGDGSSVVLNNGNSTSTFYAPSTSHTSYTASADIAGEIIVTNDWTFKIQFSVLQFLSSERRRVSHLLTGNYFF